MKKLRKEAPSYVRGTTNTLELSRVGCAIDLRVVRKGRMLGRVKVGQGALWWIPRGYTRRRAKQVPWKVFAELMKEWPFGEQKKARVKFKRGAVYWRRPGAGGPGKRMSWDEFILRMEMKLPKGAVAKPAKEAPAKQARGAPTKPAKGAKRKPAKATAAR